eukprot:7385678-Prymnesium_polylepis.1
MSIQDEMNEITYTSVTLTVRLWAGVRGEGRDSCATRDVVRRDRRRTQAGPRITRSITVQPRLPLSTSILNTTVSTSTGRGAGVVWGESGW